eukprot:Nitzschia sp. Nitz4//scaffold63_size106090//55387//57396//NITZ4_004393-RA/size106090-processed-gene-0.143-mRNA-1//-1//CDS//3329555984//7967//frame0
MVSDDNRFGLVITVPLYFCFLGSAAYWGYLRMERMDNHDHVDDKLSAHFLGGKQFGPWLLAGTIFASLFSGYTVIGVPNQAYDAGFTAASWMPSLMCVVVGYTGTGMRLYRTSAIRNHQTPVDFITDRYQSQMLRYLVVFMQTMPTLVYVSAQVTAIKSTFNSVFELDPDTNSPLIIIMMLIVIFEWIGGLSTVAITDCIQAVVMITSFVIIPSVMVKQVGGWGQLDPETYPKPSFYQTPTNAEQWTYWQFSIVNFSFFTLPHLMQRIYAAKDPKSLRYGFTAIAFGPWLTTFVGVFMGTMGVKLLADANGNPANPNNPFSEIVEVIMGTGRWGKIAGTIAVTSSFAAIMSTADSLIIAMSQLITMEIVYALRPKTTPVEISIFAKLVSFVGVIIAMIIGIFWDEGVSDLGEIQFALSSQCVPVFLFGLFATNKRTDIHPWCLFAGAFSSTIFVFVIYFGYLKPVPDGYGFHAGILGVLLQLVVAITSELIRRVLSDAKVMEEAPERLPRGLEDVLVYHGGRPMWDIPMMSRFGSACLTPQMVWETMEGISEPMSNPWWCFLMFFTLSMATPWAPALEPPLSPEGSDTMFLSPPSVVNGVPWWFFKSMIITMVVTMMLFAEIWNIPDKFPKWTKGGGAKKRKKKKKKRRRSQEPTEDFNEYADNFWNQL